MKSLKIALNSNRALLFRMDHQDWTEIKIEKKLQTNKKEIQKNFSQRAENTEVKLIPSSDLKKAMMQARVAKKLTQQELARNMNIPVTAVRNWESGKLFQITNR